MFAEHGRKAADKLLGRGPAHIRSGSCAWLRLWPPLLQLAVGPVNVDTRGRCTVHDHQASSGMLGVVESSKRLLHYLRKVVHDHFGMIACVAGEHGRSI